ncbi:iron chelate uptake ABC transporter family permease subunit [Photobacterium sp. CAU 1568]|uniref:Iron chelate uptake ABC transporter family permease subunit n=1 Tax=Photobacterium arenosum TaxID=2774143 RepID=A0ABR9BNZ4_9GAMM|nr:iron chelate uptake ABC transporter family permease subunit [Photobacterium arenosum]MBD8513949.1 iron chelate uptake ABC transporter family permease subunit [Photobacterium arenosum]
MNRSPSATYRVASSKPFSFQGVARWSLLLALAGSGAVAGLLSWSSFSLSLSDLTDLILAYHEASIAQQLIINIRLPRVLSTFMIGASLAVAGVLMQGVTRNPLASPAILGVNAGAACFMALSAIGLAVMSELHPLLCAVLGGALGGLMVIALGGYFNGNRINPVRLVLAGIAINALLAGLTRASLIMADEMAYSILYWLAGSVAEAGWQQWSLLWPVCTVALLLSFWLAPQLNTLALGDEVAESLGIGLGKVRFIAVLAILALASACVAIAGPIAFVGLIVPHVCRAIVGNDHRMLLPYAALGGATLLVWADVMARAIGFPAETPVGVVTALIGTPFFIFLSAKGRG